MHHVAICFSDASGVYYKQAAVTAASVFANANGALCLHVLHDESLAPEARDLLASLPEKEGHSLCFHLVPEISDDIEAFMPANINKGALYRLLLAELLPEADTVLYLDCDVVCECDPAELFAHDVTGFFMGAVPFGPKKQPYFIRRMGLDARRYINSGVLLLNLKKLRAELPDLKSELSAIIKAHEEKSADQEALNIFFNKRDNAFLFLPERYNCRIWQRDHPVLEFEDYKGKILHFSGKKPWEEFSHASIHYWKYHSRLFPEDKVFDLMVGLPCHEFASLCAFMLRHALLRRGVRLLYLFKKDGLVKTLWHRLVRGSGEKRS